MRVLKHLENASTIGVGQAAVYQASPEMHAERFGKQGWLWRVEAWNCYANPFAGNLNSKR